MAVASASGAGAYPDVGGFHADAAIPGPDALRARAGEENFPVALKVLPGALRADLAAVYGFARATDELGDAAASPEERTAALQAWRTDLERVWDDRSEPLSPVLRGLRPVVRRHQLPQATFADLVDANLLDQRVTRYADWDALLGYCRLSAEPIGRIVLGLFGDTDPITGLLSDRVCAALQILEHCQDVAEDHRAGRVYLPADRLAVHGVTDADLEGRAATPALRRVVLETTARAADLLEEGAPVVARLHGWGRLCVAGFVAGGRATVTALRRSGGDVLGGAPRPSRALTAAEISRLLVLGTGRRRR